MKILELKTIKSESPKRTVVRERLMLGETMALAGRNPAIGPTGSGRATEVADTVLAVLHLGEGRGVHLGLVGRAIRSGVPIGRRVRHPVPVLLDVRFHVGIGEVEREAVRPRAPATLGLLPLLDDNLVLSVVHETPPVGLECALPRPSRGRDYRRTRIPIMFKTSILRHKSQEAASAASWECLKNFSFLLLTESGISFCPENSVQFGRRAARSAPRGIDFSYVVRPVGLEPTTIRV